MSYAPFVFISAKTGQRIDKLFELIKFVREQLHAYLHRRAQRYAELRDLSACQPPSDKGKRLKIYYMTQASVCPPNFVIFCNSRELFHYSYQRYIEKPAPRDLRTDCNADQADHS